MKQQRTPKITIIEAKNPNFKNVAECIVKLALAKKTNTNKKEDIA